MPIVHGCGTGTRTSSGTSRPQRLHAGSVSYEGRPTPHAQGHLAHQVLTCGFDWGDMEQVAATCTDRPERIPQPTLKLDALEGSEVPTEFTARTVNV